LVDLAVLFLTFAPFVGVNGQMLRLVRLLRIIRLAKLGRMSAAMRHIVFALASRRYELILTMMFALCLLIFGASALYWLEGDLQPIQFGSIPRALWWAATTLTTIGYGDVVPITPVGKIVASIVALAGIGLVAMPAGILAAAFSDALRRDRGTG
jgi:voltage-gated potassium channel